MAIISGSLGRPREKSWQHVGGNYDAPVLRQRPFHGLLGDRRDDLHASNDKGQVPCCSVASLQDIWRQYIPKVRKVGWNGGTGQEGNIPPLHHSYKGFRSFYGSISL